jgi:GDP-4-dehydro-6-deoxy-D-mannose reductase
MRILVTGVNGFVGRYLLDSMENHFDMNQAKIYGTYYGNEIDSNLYPSTHLAYLDILDKEEVFKVIESTRPDYVFHMAAQSSVASSWKKPALTMDSNINGTINLLDAIREVNNKCKILIIGSSDEYGKVLNNPINEEHILNPQSPYAVSKVCQEMIGKLYVEAYGMQVVFTRSFTHTGPKQEPNFVVPDWAKQIAEIMVFNKEPVINVGNINVKRDFCDVRDVVEAYQKLIKQGKSGEIYNVGSGNVYELSHILKLLIQYSRTNIDIKVDEAKIRPVENLVVQCDSSKIYNLCGWKPNFTIEQTLKDVLEYWIDKCKL